MFRDHIPGSADVHLSCRRSASYGGELWYTHGDEVGFSGVQLVGPYVLSQGRERHRDGNRLDTFVTNTQLRPRVARQSEELTDLAWRRDGRGAGIAADRPPPRVVTIDVLRGYRVLEESYEIDPYSLTIDGSRLFWISGGRPRTAVPPILLRTQPDSPTPTLAFEGEHALVVPVSPRHSACGSARNITVFANERLRVFRRAAAGPRRWACRRGGHAAIALGEARPAPGRPGLFDFEVAGSWLAYRAARSCTAARCREVSAHLLDTSADGARAKRRLPGVADVALRLDGARAEIAADGDGWRVVRRDGDGVALLDRSPLIDPLSLVIDGDRIFWMRAGEPQTALLRALRAPENGGSPVVTGAGRVGQTLSAFAGVWWSTHPVSLAWQWLRCNSYFAPCSVIIGASAQSYTVTAADLGYYIRVAVTATNAAGSTRARSGATSSAVRSEPGERLVRVRAALACQIESGAAQDTSLCGTETASVGAAADGTLRRALLHFPIAEALPAGAMVIDATLGLSAPASAGGHRQAVTVHDYTPRVLVSWLARPWNAAATWRSADGVVPWLVPGGDRKQGGGGNAITAPLAHPLTAFRMHSGLVQPQVDRPAENNGVLVTQYDEAITRRFTELASPTAADPATRPYLDVSYTPPPPAAAAAGG